MKIPQSVRVLYQELLPRYEDLEKAVSHLIAGKKETRWHYEGRVKEIESFALKLETGRVKDPRISEDFFGCTVVVENRAKIPVAEKMVTDNFEFHERRPRKPGQTHLPPYSFDFDDLRLYVRWRDTPGAKPTGLAGMLFEIQIKTFLQHAWGIATHDFIYKTDDVDWSSSRIAYQVKAMLEHAELSIGEVKKLTDSDMLKKIDGIHADMRTMIAEIKKRWTPDQLPKDLRRLAQNLDEMLNLLDVSFDDFWGAVDEATAAGEGTKTLNLSPFAAALSALMRKRGENLFKPLPSFRGKASLFVPLEITLPPLPSHVSAKIVRPPNLGA